MNTLTFDEKLAMATRMRTSNRFQPIQSEVFNAYAVTESLTQVSTTSGDVNVYVITPNEITNERTLIVNFHGGGFINKRLDRDKLFCYKISAKKGCIVIDVDYPLSPENEFPVALNSCYDVVKWVKNNELSILPKNPDIVLIGHSAGGNLAIGVTAKLIENNNGFIKQLIAEYAPLDLFTDPEKKPIFERDLPPERARIYNGFYCNKTIRKNPYVSPAFLEDEVLKQFPKTLMIMAGQDKLVKEGQVFAARLQEQGVDVITKVYTNSVHGFTINRMDEHEASFALIASHI